MWSSCPWSAWAWPSPGNPVRGECWWFMGFLLPFVPRAVARLGARLLAQGGSHPLVELGLGLVDPHLPAHLVVAPPAKLRADQLVVPGLVGVEPDGDRQARHGVLLDPQLGQEERVQHILRLEM